MKSILRQLVIFALCCTALLPRALAAESTTLEEAILKFQWSWDNPTNASWKEILFTNDGIATIEQHAGKPNVTRWQITGPNTITLTEIANSDLKWFLTFDQTFQKFAAAFSFNNKVKASGTRKAPPAGVAFVPNQPLLETLSVQAPNASAWVLAPLDQSVASDIRQNLTYLREDLFDEAKGKPKASPEAYKLGGQLCNTMIAALDERDQALVRAGFRAVEAQTRTGVTSDALEARRNYKMSWPQFARENAQRAELKSQANAGAAVMAERPKVEWATRTAFLRKNLDTLYAQFREALRQSPAAK